MDIQAGQWLKTLTEAGVGWVTANRIRAVLPVLIMQSDRAAEAFKKAKGRLAEIKVFEQVIQNEVETRNATRRALIERIATASPVERIEIEQKLEWLDGVTRQLNISLKAVSYSEKKPASDAKDGQRVIQDHWIDRFNETARKRNENWRAELLARIWAKETSAPGSVSPRLLWLIGMLEEEAFKAFSALLDLSIWFASVPDPGPFIPDSEVNAFNLATEIKIRGNPATVGELHNSLADTGLVADMFSSRRSIHAGSEFIIRHGDKGFRVILNKEMCTHGLFFTSLGHSLAQFHDPVWNATGLQVLNRWIKSIPLGTAKVTRLEPADLSSVD